MTRRPLGPATAAFVLLVFLVFLVLAVTPRPAAGDELERGRAIYREHCQKCHGETGAGNGPEAARLGFRPRNFQLGAFKCRSTPSGQPPTDDDLARIVAEGLSGTPMVGLGDVLTADDVGAVVAYLKTISPIFERKEAIPIDLPEPPEDLAQLADEGRHVYQALRCWTCHGASGRGDGPAAKGLVDDWGNPIRVFNFVVFKRFKCGGEPRDLYRTLHTGLTGSAMPSYTAAFGVGREQLERAAGLEQVYDAEAVAAFGAWVAEQPEQAAIQAVADEEVEALVEHRTWALVAYLRALAGR